MGKSNDIVTGYEYRLDVQMALTHGPIDSLTEFIYGERQAWEGEITGNETVFISKPELFGGETREGGVEGYLTVTMGDSEIPDPHLVETIGPNVPAYIGMCTVIFKDFLWSKVNPYFKPPWFRIKRIFAGWDRGGGVWYPEKAQVGTYDMNPAHIIYQCITDRRWGMGYSPADIDEVSFMAAADQLYAEGFGMSLRWSVAMRVEDFVQIICNTINGGWDLNLRTGLFALKLIRDIEDPETLIELNPDNILEMSSFQRVAWGEQANKIIVKYTDRDQNEQSVTVDNLAAIEIEGEIAATKEYLGIRDEALAYRVAMRDLNTSSSPLAKATLRTNQVLWEKGIGDAVALTWPKLGLDKIPFRILSITRTELDDGSIRVELIEDVFGLPEGTYVAQQPGLWIDPVQPPIPIENAKAIEAPFWDVIRRLSAADFAQLTPGYGFGEVFAARPTSDAFNFKLFASPDNSAYEQVSTGDFCATGTLINALTKNPGDVLLELENTNNLQQIDIDAYAYIGEEAVAVLSVDLENRTVTVGRGVIDTVPHDHPAGSRVYFAGIDKGIDPNEHVMGETEYYKPLTHNGLGTSDIASATALPVAFQNRAARPYPPGNFKINELYYPEDLRGPLEVSWAFRNRLTQTADLIPNETGNIGPEPGTTYTIRAARVDTGGVLVEIIDASSPVLIDPGYTGEVEISVEAVRDGLVSWQRARHATEYLATGYGRAYGLAYGGVRTPGTVKPRPAEPYPVWSLGDSWAYIESLPGYIADGKWLLSDVSGTSAFSVPVRGPGSASDADLVTLASGSVRDFRTIVDEDYSSQPSKTFYFPSGTGWSFLQRIGPRYYFRYAPSTGSAQADWEAKSTWYTDGTAGATPILAFQPTDLDGYAYGGGTATQPGQYPGILLAFTGGLSDEPVGFRPPDRPMKVHIIDEQTLARTTYDVSHMVTVRGQYMQLTGAHPTGGFIFDVVSPSGSFTTSKSYITYDLVNFTPVIRFQSGAWVHVVIGGSAWPVRYGAGHWWWDFYKSADGEHWEMLPDIAGQGSGYTGRLRVLDAKDGVAVIETRGTFYTTGTIDSPDFGYVYTSATQIWRTTNGTTFQVVTLPALPAPPPNAPDLPNAPGLYPYPGRIIAFKNGWLAMYPKQASSDGQVVPGIAIYYTANLTASPTWLPLE